MNNNRNNGNTSNSRPKLRITFEENQYVQEAENVILELKKTNYRIEEDVLTTNQIRNLLSLTSAVYDEVRSSGVTKVQDRLAYLRIQFIYQSGRNQVVKALVQTGQIIELLSKVQKENDKDLIIRFCHYMEALVAYFKFYEEKQK